MLKADNVTVTYEKNKFNLDLQKMTEQTKLAKDELEIEKIKNQSFEHEKTKLERQVRDLLANKAKLTNEKNTVIKDRDNTKRYLSAIEREFNWLKKKTEEEQNNILKLERDRNKLNNEFVQQEAESAKNLNKIAELKNLQTNQELATRELLDKIKHLTT